MPTRSIRRRREPRGHRHQPTLDRVLSRRAIERGSDYAVSAVLVEACRYRATSGSWIGQKISSVVAMYGIKGLTPATGSQRYATLYRSRCRHGAFGGVSVSLTHADTFHFHSAPGGNIYLDQRIHPTIFGNFRGSCVLNAQLLPAITTLLPHSVIPWLLPCTSESDGPLAGSQ